jgi:phage gpG-like protein
MTMLSEVSIELKLPQFADAARKARAELPGLIAATMQTQRGQIFDSEGTYNGRPGWKPLKCREGQILKDRGTLSQSIGPRNDGKNPAKRVGSIVRISGNLVTIGTDIAYAAVQNYGHPGIKPVRAKALRFKCGKRWVFAKKVRIPARPFADWYSDDVRELQQTCANYLSSLVGDL